jgi:ribosomal protein S10
MTFVTTLRLESGDRTVLDRVVGNIRSITERKGAKMKGPHTTPPEKLSVTLYRSTTGDGDAEFGRWNYTVYSRTIELVGHEQLARQITEWDFPRSVKVEVEVDRRAGMGA